MILEYLLRTVPQICVDAKKIPATTGRADNFVISLKMFIDQGNFVP